MTKEIQDFLAHLKTVKNKACQERVHVKTVYNRARRGVYEIINIDGVQFVVEPEKKEE